MADEFKFSRRDEPISRNELANILAQIAVTQSAIADACADLMLGKPSDAKKALGDVLSEMRAYSALLREFVDGKDE